MFRYLSVIMIKGIIVWILLQLVNGPWFLIVFKSVWGQGFNFILQTGFKAWLDLCCSD